MNYSDGYFRISTGGLYYIYAQLYFDTPGQSAPGFGFDVVVNNVSVAYASVYDENLSQEHDVSQYAGAAWNLEAGDEVFVQIFDSNTHYYFDCFSSFFGLFQVA